MRGRPLLRLLHRLTHGKEHTLKHTMKISAMTTHDILDRMGGNTTDAEVDAMRELLEAGGWTDTDEISDTRWVELIADAVEKAR